MINREGIFMFTMIFLCHHSHFVWHTGKSAAMAQLEIFALSARLAPELRYGIWMS
jgi:hypothetical protein